MTFTVGLGNREIRPGNYPSILRTSHAFVQAGTLWHPSQDQIARQKLRAISVRQPHLNIQGNRRVFLANRRGKRKLHAIGLRNHLHKHLIRTNLRARVATNRHLDTQINAGTTIFSRGYLQTWDRPSDSLPIATRLRHQQVGLGDNPGLTRTSDPLIQAGSLWHSGDNQIPIQKFRSIGIVQPQMKIQSNSRIFHRRRNS